MRIALEDFIDGRQQPRWPARLAYHDLERRELVFLPVPFNYLVRLWRHWKTAYRLLQGEPRHVFAVTEAYKAGLQRTEAIYQERIQEVWHQGFSAGREDALRRMKRGKPVITHGEGEPAQC